MCQPEKIDKSSCYVCGEEKTTEILCSSQSYSYDNDEDLITEEVCWAICNDCLTNIESKKAYLASR